MARRKSGGGVAAQACASSGGATACCSTRPSGSIPHNDALGPALLRATCLCHEGRHATMRADGMHRTYADLPGRWASAEVMRMRHDTLLTASRVIVCSRASDMEYAYVAVLSGSSYCIAHLLCMLLRIGPFAPPPVKQVEQFTPALFVHGSTVVHSSTVDQRDREIRAQAAECDQDDCLQPPYGCICAQSRAQRLPYLFSPAFSTLSLSPLPSLSSSRLSGSGKWSRRKPNRPSKSSCILESRTVSSRSSFNRTACGRSRCTSASSTSCMRLVSFATVREFRV